jgi:hypothetical protein
MLLARAARPLARARALSTPTFTLHAFTDGNDLGFGRGAQFCMLNLRHDALFAKGDPAALYAEKYAARRARIKRLFEKLDSLELGALDRAALSKGLDGIGLPASPERLDRVFKQFESGSGNLALEGFEAFLVETCVDINQCAGCTRQFFISHFSAMARPSWLGRAARNRHRDACSMAWRTTR